MNPMQLLNQLYAGKKIKLRFETKNASEIFRQRIYKLKKTQDAAMSAVLDEEKLVLKCKPWTVSDSEGEPQYYTLELWTEELKAPSYQVLSIEEGERPQHDAGEITDASKSKASPEKISGDLAETHGIKIGYEDSDSGPKS